MTETIEVVPDRIDQQQLAQLRGAGRSDDSVTSPPPGWPSPQFRLDRSGVTMSVREKSFGFWIVIAGLGALVLISLVAIFKYSAVADASGVVTAAGTVIGTVVGTFFGVHAGSAAGGRVPEPV
ncbi:MAG TPA: hypothetical protein VFP34_00785 [Microlunatus sp.]|nr:hypothetical protein [Microlunatus sp.]